MKRADAIYRLIFDEIERLESSWHDRGYAFEEDLECVYMLCFTSDKKTRYYRSLLESVSSLLESVNKTDKGTPRTLKLGKEAREKLGYR